MLDRGRRFDPIEQYSEEIIVAHETVHFSEQLPSAHPDELLRPKVRQKILLYQPSDLPDRAAGKASELFDRDRFVERFLQHALELACELFVNVTVGGVVRIGGSLTPAAEQGSDRRQRPGTLDLVAVRAGRLQGKDPVQGFPNGGEPIEPDHWRKSRPRPVSGMRSVVP